MWNNWLENKEAIWFRKRCQDIHKNKLKLISSQGKRIDNNLPYSVTTREKINKGKLLLESGKIFISDKIIEIRRENQKLLEKLVSISSFKHKKTGSNTPRSLNVPYRRRQAQQIAQENEAFARRLVHKKSGFSRNTLNKDWENKKKLITMLSRFGNNLPNINESSRVVRPKPPEDYRTLSGEMKSDTSLS